MKRRLKNEIYNKKKFQQIEKNTEEAREFEESLLRLAQLAKNRIKLGDFTTRDKCNLLDLFVNNEKTLLKIYEALFPHRAATQPGNNNSIMHANPEKDKQITLKNSQISQQLAYKIANSGALNYLQGGESVNDPYSNNNNSLIMGGGIVSAGPTALPMLTPPVNNRTMVEFGSLRNSNGY